VIIDCAHYQDGVRQHEDALDLEHAAKCVNEEEGFVWVGAYEPTDEELERITEAFSLPPLAVEDASSEHQRPKLEEYDDCLFAVLKTARYDEAEERVHFGEIDLFVGPKYVISVRHDEAADLRPARERVEKEHRDLLQYGTSAVAWAILDEVVDNYEPVVAGIEDDIEEVEQEVFEAKTESIQRIYFLKREAIEFHRAVAPLLAPLEALERGVYPQVQEALRPFFRDVGDHARRVDEQVMSHRELLTSILEANLALINLRQNEVVKAVSAWAAIAGVIAVLTGIWGMNFDHMPELRLAYGYPLALLTMMVSVGVLYRFFKRLGWL
jgi:magnesium transporter